MTINQLMKRLEEYRELIGGDAEVRMMAQKHWPVAYEIAGVCSSDDIEDLSDKNDTSRDDQRTTDSLLYVVEGPQFGYGTKRAWEIAH